MIAPTLPARRTLARVVLEQTGKHRLLTITHRLSLRVGFGKPNFKQILSQGHLCSAFHYILDQEPRHGLVRDPYREASNLSDLLGLRVIGAFTATNVRELLPRITRSDLLRHLGVERLTDSDAPLDQLVPASLAATGLSDLTVRSEEGRRARRAAKEVVNGRLTAKQLAAHIGVAERTVYRLTDVAVDARLVAAIRLQLALRRIKPEAPSGVFDR